MRPDRLAFLALLVVATASCTFEATTAPAKVKIEEATFSPSLGITLSAMTKTSSGLYYQDVVAGTGVTAVSGNTVYVGGIFTSIGGQPRNRIAAIDATTGLATAWNPNADSWEQSLAVSGGIVYAGGAFTNILVWVNQKLGQSWHGRLRRWPQ